MAVGDFAFSEILTGTKKLYTKNTANETTVTTMQNAAIATGNGISLDVSGMGTAICQVSGTFVGTITFEASLDNSVFGSIDVQKLSGGLISSVVTDTGFYKIPCNGVKYIRARVSAYTSGAITVKGYAEALSCSDNAIQLSGRNVEVYKSISKITGDVLTSANEITTIIPPAKTLVKPSYLNISIAAPIGATAGTHTVIVGVTTTGSLLTGLRWFYLNAPYNLSLTIMLPGDAYETGRTENHNTTIATVLKRMENSWFSAIEPLKIAYVNNTDVTQTNARNYTIFGRKEGVI